MLKQIVEKCKSMWDRIAESFEIFLLLLEIHFFKIFFFFTFWAATSQLHILNLLILILLSIAAYNNTSRFKCSITIVIAILSVSFVFVTFLFNNPTTDSTVKSRAMLRECQGDNKMFGFEVKKIGTWLSDQNKSLAKRLWPYFVYIFIVTMFYIFKRRQQNKRNERGGSIDLPCIVFAGVSRENSDTSLTNLIKFLVNYGFYKFGIEITLIMFIIVIFTRLEVFTVFYIFWLVLIVFRNRDTAEKLWKVATFSVLVSIIVQCLILLLYIVITPCKRQEKWSINNVWFFIFDNTHSLNDKPSLIIGDFVLLILMTSQLAVFEQEKSRNVLKPFEAGGSNRTILTEIINIDGLDIFEHPIYTFGEKFHNVVDVIKWFVFKIQFWVSLASIFLLGTLNIDVFSLGYVFGAFVFLWQGTSFFKKNIRGILKWWNVMLMYNLSSFIIKILLKVLGCTFGEKIPRKYCWFADLLDIPCSDSNLKSSFCESFKKYSPFLLDSFVFVVIIMQRRIFLSYYFFNVINETFLTEILASRGAEVVEDLRFKEVKRQRAEAEAELRSLKVKMEKIKRSAYAVKMRPRLYHDGAILNGGYYMFDDEDKNSTLINEEAPKSETLEEDQIGTISVMSVKVTAKRFFSATINKLILIMHNKSKNYISILQILAKERKILKLSLSPRVYRSREAIEQKISRINRDRQITAMRRVDDKLKQLAVASALRKKESNEPDAIMYKVGRETFYFLLSYSDVLAYCAVCLVQIQTSSLLTLPLSFSLFLWATLTFPRPSKTFWTLLIAYTQIVVFIKLVSQSDLHWWNTKNYYIKIFGNKKHTSFAVIELLLLMVVFLHRSMLMKFGLWTSVEDYSLNEGKFAIIECDPQTSEVIKMCLKEGSVEDGMVETVAEDTSKDALIVNEDDIKQTILVKHEVKLNYEDGKMRVEPVFKDRIELLKANENIFTEDDGENVIKLSQDEVRMKLGPLNSNIDIDRRRIAVIEIYVEEPSDFASSIVWLSMKQHCYMLRNLFNFIAPTQVAARKRVDVYTAMFFCDFINFLVLLFGFSEFVVQSKLNDSRSILDYLKENKVPKALLLLLVIQFAMIIIDRVLYLRKSKAGKVIFHVFTIFYTHIWMFLILPACTGQTLVETTLPKLYYIIKCCYMLLSAYQIRYGFPKRIMGNFIMKSYGYAWLIGFKIYMNIPILFEIRVLIDWMCTATSLEFSEWVRVESIYAQVYQIKCQRLYAETSSRRGEKKAHWKKYLHGGALTSLLIAIIWFPLILFALSPALGKPNIPSKITMSLQLGSYEPIYEFEATQSSIRQFRSSEWITTLSLYDKNPSALYFLQDYEADCLIAARFSANSSSSWNISPPSADKIVSDIKDGTLKYCQLSWKISRKTFAKSLEIVQSSSDILLDETVREGLISMLENPEEAKPVVIENIFQKIVMQKNGKLSIVPELLPGSNGKVKRDLTLQLRRSNRSSWWKIKEDCTDIGYNDVLQKLPYQNCDEVVTLFMFNEKTFPSHFSTLAVKGIAGLYVTLMVFFSRVLRSSISNLSNISIIVEELPNVDRIISLCQDIYLVRESQEFLLEEDLVAKLLFLYRSPETLIKWTKLKDE